MEVRDIILFPVWIIPFPVLGIDFETHGTNKKDFVKEVFYLRPRSGSNNSISCLIIPFPVLKTNFEPLGSNKKMFVKEIFEQRPVTWSNNSIYCFDHSISCF